jgi:hypothetical protein
LLNAREIESAFGTELAKVFAALEQRDDDVRQRDAGLQRTDRTLKAAGATTIYREKVSGAR